MFFKDREKFVVRPNEIIEPNEVAAAAVKADLEKSTTRSYNKGNERSRRIVAVFLVVVGILKSNNSKFVRSLSAVFKAKHDAEFGPDAGEIIINYNCNRVVADGVIALVKYIHAASRR